MTTYILLIKFSPELAKDYASMERMGQEVREKYMKACPSIALSQHHYWLSGPFDFMHVFDSPDADSAFTMAAVILSTGMASRVETWTALNYQHFLGLVKDIS
jgi:uncharacterized protein with GYD domain